jgi:hypothetical protein
MNHYDRSGPDTAAEIVVSVPSVDERIVPSLTSPSYRSYLTRAREGPVAVGVEWEEFVNRGCGTTHDVLLRVESVSGRKALGEATDLAFEPREA